MIVGMFHLSKDALYWEGVLMEYNQAGSIVGTVPLLRQCPAIIDMLEIFLTSSHTEAKN
jgi:hypothetical protein